jgi:hypothetical protein
LDNFLVLFNHFIITTGGNLTRLGNVSLDRLLDRREEVAFMNSEANSQDLRYGPIGRLFYLQVGLFFQGSKFRRDCE